jgi:DNA-binding GntR family transcriptional regulator
MKKRIRKASSEHIAAVLNYVKAHNLKTATEITEALNRCSISTIRDALKQLISQKLVFKKSGYRFVAAEVGTLKVEPPPPKKERATRLHMLEHPVVLWGLQAAEVGYVIGHTAISYRWGD